MDLSSRTLSLTTSNMWVGLLCQPEMSISGKRMRQEGNARPAESNLQLLHSGMEGIAVALSPHVVGKGFAEEFVWGHLPYRVSAWVSLWANGEVAICCV